MRLCDARMAVRPGRGLVGRSRRAVFVVAADAADDERLVEELAEASELRAGAEPLQSRLRGIAGGAGGSPSSFAVIVEDRESTLLIVSGSLRATVFDRGAGRELTALEANGWLELEVPASAERIVLGELDAAGEVSPLIDLQEGIVPGAGAALEPVAGAAGARDLDAAAAPDGRTDPRMPRTVSLLDPPPSAAREPLAAPGAPESPSVPAEDRTVKVQGILCGRGHFNHPEAAYCAQCGLSMAQLTHYLVSGARPPLGLLALDDGSAYTLDADYVIGATPGDDEAIASGRARALTLEGDAAIAAVHAEVRLDGWDVTLVDRESPSGTLIKAHDAEQWQAVTGVPVRLAPRTTIRLGARTLVYHSHRERQRG